jgi:predicted transcriptional regulator
MSNINISPAQRRVLEEAANTPNESVEKFTLHMPTAAQKSVLDALINKGCIEQKGYGYYITATGLNAVGRDATPCNTEQQQKSKQAIIIELLSRAEGATLPMLISATGWKSHSVRGHLSNLRKKRGFNIETFTNTDGSHGYKIPQLPQETAA